MKLTDLQKILLEQIDNTRPDHIEPGKDVGAVPLENGVRLVFPASTRYRERMVEIVYHPGSDDYRITESKSETLWVPHIYEGMYADQLGEIVWGENAKEFTLPMMTVIDWPDGMSPQEAVQHHFNSEVVDS